MNRYRFIYENLKCDSDLLNEFVTKYCSTSSKAESDLVLGKYMEKAHEIYQTRFLERAKSLEAEGYTVEMWNDSELILRSDGVHKWAVGLIPRKGLLDVIWLNEEDAKRHKPFSWIPEIEA